MVQGLLGGAWFQLAGMVANQWLSDTDIAVDEVIPEPSAIAEKIAVHLPVVPVPDRRSRPVTLSRDRIAPQPAMDTTDGAVWRSHAR